MTEVIVYDGGGVNSVSYRMRNGKWSYKYHSRSDEFKMYTFRLLICGVIRVVGI